MKTVSTYFGMMQMRWTGYAAALMSIALMTAVIGLLLGYFSISSLSMLYLVVVLTIAVAFGRGPAIFASIMAFLFVDWFFTEPLHTFTIIDPAEWIALGLFLLTAIITSELAAGQRQRAEEAKQHERETGRGTVM